MSTQPSQISTLRSALDHGAVTAQEISEAAIRKAHVAENLFITVGEDSRYAIQADQRIKSGNIRSPLDGIPFAAKDVINTVDFKTTMGSNVFADHRPSQNATVIQKLLDAGANLIGKTNTQEFSYGIRGDSGAYGVVVNPYDPTRIAGGSSSGSAAAVAKDIVPFAVGTDTAGSVRVPAALCGVVGFKPTYELLDTAGIFPLAPSFDTVGFLAPTVKDIRSLMETLLTGQDFESRPLGSDLSYRVLDDNPIYGGSGLSESFAREIVQSLGASTVSHPRTGTDFHFMELYNVVRSREAFLVHEAYVTQMPEKYQPDVLRRIQSGKVVSDEQATEARGLIAEASKIYATAFEDIDILFSSTVPIEAPLLRESVPTAEALMSQCLIWNLLGWPALSVPYWTRSSPLPHALQVIGKPGQDMKVLETGAVVQELLTTESNREKRGALPRSKTTSV